MTTYTLSTSFGDIPLTVSERGQGRPVLLLHGGAGPSSVAGLADLMAARSPLRVLDPRQSRFRRNPAPRPARLDPETRRALRSPARPSRSAGRDRHRQLDRWLGRSRARAVRERARRATRPGRRRRHGKRRPPCRRLLRPHARPDRRLQLREPRRLSDRPRRADRRAESRHRGQPGGPAGLRRPVDVRSEPERTPGQASPLPLSSSGARRTGSRHRPTARSTPPPSPAPPSTSCRTPGTYRRSRPRRHC